LRIFLNRENSQTSFSLSFFFLLFPSPLLSSATLESHYDDQPSPEDQLIVAAGEGNLVRVRELLRENPDMSINLGDDYDGMTALHCASLWNRHKVVKELLRHPGIDVNVLDDEGDTAFLIACMEENKQIIRLLIKDPRVDLAIPDPEGCTPLWKACSLGSIETIIWLIACGRELGDLSAKGFEPEYGEEYSP